MEGIELTAAGAVLLGGGFLMLAAGIATGVVMGQVRQEQPDTPKYLRLAHLSGYQQAPILFGLVWAVAVSGWADWIDLTGAVLVVVAAILLTAKDLVNNAQGVTDEFVEKGLGYKLGVVMGPLHLAGVAILAVGAFT